MQPYDIEPTLFGSSYSLLGATLLGAQRSSPRVRRRRRSRIGACPAGRRNRMLLTDPIRPIVSDSGGSPAVRFFPQPGGWEMPPGELQSNAYWSAHQRR
ncbi:hypothetical protein GCM10010430_67260 [Kitasatospora cystarginea]|uniref:Uncharacterized protein n=1 Tax=Kitasatospora cystarginea TaxID=58350 RepID=A0ABP5RR72_9ACTN